MSQIRYFVLNLRERWTIRRDTRRIGAFADQDQAVMTALELAAIDRVRGHAVEVLMQETDGRWTPAPHGRPQA